MQADRQQQRDPNKDRRRAADKYRFNSKEIRTEVDEEQQTNTDSAAERSEQRQIVDGCRQTEPTQQYPIQNEAKPNETKRMQNRM
ncbi:hypothetical protein Tco_0835026 [Tanacetum coccineum]